MKRIVNINQTFRVIRQLPLAVTYEQVERWVRLHENQPIKKQPANSWLRKLLHRISKN